MEDSRYSVNPPAMDGLTWRAFGREDLGALVDLERACFAVDGGLHFMAEAVEVGNRYFPADQTASIGAFDAEGRLAGCAVVYLVGGKAGDLARIMGDVDPRHRGKGIGDFLLRWSQDQAGRMLEPNKPGERVMQIRTAWHNESSKRLYEAHGFVLANDDLVMRRDLGEPLPDRPLPPGISLTTWRPELAGKFFEAYQAAFRERPGFPGMTQQEWVENWTVDNDPFRPEWSFLAQAGEQPIGFHMASVNPPHGFTMQVGVVPAWRRKGISSALMTEAMRRMREAGLISAQLNVYTNNPGAIKNYERLGYRTIGRRARYEKQIA